MDVHSTNVLTIVCASNFQSASIFGTAHVNGSGSVDYRIDVKDLDRRGMRDHYRITLSNGYDSGDQPLGGGNVTIHPASKGVDDRLDRSWATHGSAEYRD
jgi:hypothetical protein